MHIYVHLNSLQRREGQRSFVLLEQDYNTLFENREDRSVTLV
jgi:hypothetical protein